MYFFLLLVWIGLVEILVLWLLLVVAIIVFKVLVSIIVERLLCLLIIKLFILLLIPRCKVVVEILLLLLLNGPILILINELLLVKWLLPLKVPLLSQFNFIIVSVFSFFSFFVTTFIIIVMFFLPVMLIIIITLFSLYIVFLIFLGYLFFKIFQNLTLECSKEIFIFFLILLKFEIWIEATLSNLIPLLLIKLLQRKCTLLKNILVLWLLQLFISLIFRFLRGVFIFFLVFGCPTFIIILGLALLTLVKRFYNAIRYFVTIDESFFMNSLPILL
jgi:hypothetical protein